MVYITTFTGKKIDLINPTAEMFCIEDIAHSLANSTRFNGHTYHPYNTAQHSILVAHLLEGTGLEYEGLMHDSPESVSGDIVRPLKNMLPDFKEFEDKISGVMSKVFHFTYPMPEEVALADKEACDFEKRNLFKKNNLCWPAKFSKQLFLEKYECLSKKLNTYPQAQLEFGII